MTKRACDHTTETIRDQPLGQHLGNFGPTQCKSRVFRRARFIAHDIFIDLRRLDVQFFVMP
jgi:hypothetical protein